LPREESGNVPKFSDELFDEICNRLSSGESLRAICKDDDMPVQGTIYRWLDESEDLQERYARARTAQADTIFDECLAIADQYDEAADKGEGGVEHIQRARLRIDTRKWMAGKLRPSRYGEKLDLNHSGGVTVTLESDTEDL
jgi:hypothetical protein